MLIKNGVNKKASILSLYGEAHEFLALHSLVQGAVDVVFLAIVFVCHCKVSISFVRK